MAPRPARTTHKRPVRVGEPSLVSTSDEHGWARLLSSARREAVVATFWSRSGLPADVSSATVRVRGRRRGVRGALAAGDHFTREDRLEGLPPGGPFTVTTVVAGVNPGEWTVSAELMTRMARSAPGRRRVPERTQRLELAGWSWRRWSPRPLGEPVLRSGPEVLALRPAVVFGIWPSMVGFGIVAALVAQAVLAARADLPVGRVLAISAVGVVLGAVGAKVWYLVQRRPGQSWNGWCIQGFIAAVVLIAVVVVPVVGVPLGVFLDVTTPPMFVGMAVGRVGCFFAGCCFGRPTCSRFGVWSSDRRLGIRRIPAQLIEAALALVVAAGALVVVLAGADTPNGWLFVAALASYTLCRQWLLRLRAAPRRTSAGTTITTVASIAAGLAAVVMLTAR